MEFREMLPAPPCSFFPALATVYVFMPFFWDWPWAACAFPGSALFLSLMCWVGHCLIERNLRRALVRLLVIAVAFLPAALMLVAMFRR